MPRGTAKNLGTPWWQIVDTDNRELARFDHQLFSDILDGASVTFVDTGGDGIADSVEADLTMAACVVRTADIEPVSADEVKQGRSILAVADDDGDDYPSDETLSLCVDCVRHDSLKAFVRAHSGDHDQCGACLRRAPATLVCALSEKQRLSYLLRALIRFYYDEDDYNDHLGGERPEALLEGDNLILALDAAALARKPEILDFIGTLAASLPFPDYDKGIWLFHKNDGWPASAISRTESRDLRAVRLRLATENYFNLEPEVREHLDRAGARIDMILPAGVELQRARIGIADEIVTGLLTERRVYPRPFSGAALGAPPASMATTGRLNRAGVSFLYLASDIKTAASEVRPHPSHRLSLGTYQSVRDLRIANFTADIALFADSDTDLDTFHFLHSTDMSMAMPVLPGAANRYMITQLIADVLRQMGYDGVRYASSVSAGYNVCVFDASSFRPVEGTEQVYRVTKVEYDLSPIESRLVAGEDDDVRKA